MDHELMMVENKPKLSNAAVLDTLHASFSPEDLTLSLGYVLHVPEVWQQLHDAQFLTSMLATKSQGVFTPSDIVGFYFDLQDAHPNTPLADSLESDLQRTFQAALTGSEKHDDFESIALLALAIARRSTIEDGVEEIVELVMRDPIRMRSPLACAWNWIDDRKTLLTALVVEAGRDGLALAVHMLMANLPLPQAAQLLFDLASDRVDQIQIDLMELGQSALAIQLADILRANISMQDQDLKKGLGEEHTTHRAFRYLIQEDYDSARTELNRAWEDASLNLASIADQIATTAHLEGDRILEAEARQRALQTFATPYRRARFATSMLELDRIDEALASLQMESESTEERIAAVLALIALGDNHQAHSILQPTLEHLADDISLEDYWLKRLLEGLRSAGKTNEALDVARLRLARIPADTAARNDFASSLASAGDHLTAAEQAAITLTLDPDRQDTKRLLATNLMKAGFPERSLPYWQALAEQNDGDLRELARCALEADQPELAERAASQMLEKDPESSKAKVLLGRAKTALGQIEKGREILDSAVQAAPDDPDGWLALAKCQEVAGDVNIAGKTLAKSLQQFPHNGHLHIAQAEWLRNQDKWNEAMAAAKRAVDLDPENVDWLLELGHILTELGHMEEALPVFRQGLTAQPQNLKVRMALGQIYEAKNEMQAAARLMKDIPEHAPPQVHFLAGRILTKSASSGDKSMLAEGLDHLHIAKGSNPSDSAIDFWLARAHEQNEQPEQAFAHYQRCLQNQDGLNEELSRETALGAARTALATDQDHLALSILEAAYERFPASEGVLTLLAKSYRSAGLLDQAIKVAYQAVELDPANPQPLRTLYAAAAEAEDWQMAMHATRLLLENHPDDRQALLGLAKSSYHAGNVQDSRDALAKAVWLNRRDPQLLQRSAELLIEMTESKTAQRILQRCADLEPTNPDAYEALARICESLGQFDLAQKAWRRCVELDPENLIALNHGAKALHQLGRRSAAIGMWQRALNLEADNPDLHLNLARAYTANGEHQKGLNHYRLALELHPTSPQLASEAGSAALRHGSELEALEILQAAIRLSPQDPNPLLNLGECLIRLERVAEAQELLQRAKSMPDCSARVDALLAQIELHAGNPTLANSLLDSIDPTRITCEGDAISIANVALRAGQWQLALDSLEAHLAREESLEILVALTKLRLRLLDSYWLYATVGEAFSHAPGDEVANITNLEAIQNLISRCVEAAASASTIEQLKRWAHWSTGSAEAIKEVPQSESYVQHPDGELLHAQAIAYLRSSQASLAMDVLKSSPSSLGPDSWGALLLGLCYTSPSEIASAAQAFQIAARHVVIQPLANYLSGKAKWSAGLKDEARSDVNHAVSAWSDEPAWHFTLAEMYLEEMLFDSAIPHLQQAIVMAPDQTVYQQALARALYSTGQLSEALTLYRAIIQVAPEDSVAWKEAAQLALANGEAKTALAWFERASTLAPSDPACLIGAAKAANQQGLHDDALRHVEAAARIAPTDLDVLVGMGEILANQGKFEKALRAYDQAMKRTPDQLNIRIARDKLLIRIGRADHAISDLQEALETYPEQDIVWETLSEALAETGDYEAAIEAAANATRLAPRDPTYRLLMGRLCRLSGQLDRALDELMQAQTNAPTDAHVAREMGQVFEQRREFARALESYQRALQLDPDDDVSHYHAGLILKQQKAYPQAARMLERAVEINPKDSDALQQLAAVRALELVHGGL